MIKLNMNEIKNGLNLLNDIQPIDLTPEHLSNLIGLNLKELPEIVSIDTNLNNLIDDPYSV